MTWFAPRNAAALFRPCPSESGSCLRAGCRRRASRITKRHWSSPCFFSVVTVSAIACSAALIFLPSDSLSGALHGVIDNPVQFLQIHFDLPP